MSQACVGCVYELWEPCKWSCGWETIEEFLLGEVVLMNSRIHHLCVSVCVAYVVSAVLWHIADSQIQNSQFDPELALLTVWHSTRSPRVSCGFPPGSLVSSDCSKISCMCIGYAKKESACVFCPETDWCPIQGVFPPHDQSSRDRFGIKRLLKMN